MMSWRVLSSVICPNTGIVYSHIVGLKLLRLIIWYESDIYLLPGDRIHTTKNGIFVNGVFNQISLYNVSPYNENLWDEIKNKMACPFNKTWILNAAHTLSIAMRANARTDLKPPL
ncbi:lycopene biosynthesis protein [Enterobacter roggenkampii]|uniref:lycopene biosynthesis protein n=1 Tax=Enterobacter roggenkampii TaxID=1812935 RepID=UPI0019D16834|nr:lycopene biosynthesis protein [Enterobacter roggenkampii]HCW3118299.1 lycopene biosynthesis protein [Enterobacter roggenkampii]HDR2470180.1 lycopene biosynthesis protein [Enterobacter roggenkampii]